MVNTKVCLNVGCYRTPAERQARIEAEWAVQLAQSCLMQSGMTAAAAGRNLRALLVCDGGGTTV